MKYLCIALIKFYRKFISPLKPPTCSQYALEAFTVHGFFYGGYLTLRRILRCNPFCKAGYDPVPPKKQKNK